MEFKYNIIELWSSGQLNTLDPVKLESTQTILIWRKGLTNQFRIVSNDLEQQALKFVLAGVNFNAFCEYLNVNWAAREEQIGLILQQWVSDELLLNDVKLTNY